MPELRANKEKPNFDNNPKLIEAITEMRANFNADNQNKVINAALRCTFYVPATIMQQKKPTGQQEVVFDENNRAHMQEKVDVQTSARFILISNNKTNDKYFPVFTDKEELAKLKTDQPYQAFAMKFGDLAAITEQNPAVKGFVINPFHENLPFTQEMLTSIGQTLLKVKKEREAAANSAQDEQPGAGITHTVNSDPE